MSFAGIDFSQHGNWERVQAPAGQTYYVIPGNPGYVYDPFLSQAKGRTVIWTNPTYAVEEKKKAEKQARDAQSPVNQMLPVAGVVGGTVAANYAIDALSPPSAQDKLVEAIAGKQTPVAPAPNTAQQAFTGSALGAPPQAAGVAPQLPAQNPSNAQAMQMLDAADGQVVGVTKDGNAVLKNGDVITPDGTFYTATQIAQGALGGVQIYQGMQDFKQGNYLGGAVNTASGAAMVGSALGSQTAAAALPVLGPVAGLYGGYQTAKYQSDAPSGGARNRNSAIGGAAAGAAIGSAVPGVGTLIGAGVGALVGLAGSYFGSSKGKDQMIRDKARESWQQAGLLDEKWQGTLADGSKFDFGKDGKGLGKIKYDDPVTSKVIGLANTLSAAEGAAGRSTEALAHLYTGAALSNAGGDYEKAKANMLHFANQRGMNAQNVQMQLTKMRDEKQITEDQYKAYSNGANQLFGASKPQENNQKRSHTKSPGIGLDGKRLTGKEAFLKGATRGK